MTVATPITLKKLDIAKAAESFTSLGRILKKILFFSLADDRIAPKQCLSVHLDRGCISAVFGRTFMSRIKIDGIQRYPTEGGNDPAPEAFASTIALARHDLKATKADLTLIVPRHWTIIKTVDFPATVLENLANVVSYELDRLTPLSPEKAYYDYRIIREDGNRIIIMLFVIKSDTLNPYLNALGEKGIVVKNVMVSLSAIGALSYYAHRGNYTMFVDSHPEHYESGFIDRGKIVSCIRGDFTSQGAKEKVHQIAKDINPVIDALKKQGKKLKVYINDREGLLSQLPAVVQAPVVFFGQTDLNLRFSHKRSTIPYTALGGALASMWPRVDMANLLHKGVHPSSKPPMFLTVILFATLAVLASFYLLSPIQIQEKKVEALDREIALHKNEVRKIETLKKDIEGLEKEISTINQFKTLKPAVMNLVRELTLILPKDAWLTRCRIAESTIDIEGYAKSATDILPKLEASRYFKKVEFASPTFRDVRLNADRFVIKMEIEGFSEEKSKIEKKK